MTLRSQSKRGNPPPTPTTHATTKDSKVFKYITNAVQNIKVFLTYVLPSPCGIYPCFYLACPSPCTKSSDRREEKKIRISPRIPGKTVSVSGPLHKGIGYSMDTARQAPAPATSCWSRLLSFIWTVAAIQSKKKSNLLMLIQIRSLPL